MSIAVPAVEPLDGRKLFCELHSALALAEPELLAISQAIKINFQPAAAPVPVGYVADAGAPLADRGNGLTYGWTANNTANARDRNAPGAPSQVHDTLNHMQLNGTRDWNISLASGRYGVKLLVGDPSYFDSNYVLNLEGKTVLSAKPTAAGKFYETTTSIDVIDGFLTLTSGSGAVNNKINAIEIVYLGPAQSAPVVTPPAVPLAGDALAMLSAGNGQISGYVVNDVNRDGKWSSGEKGIAGRTVYIDLNNNAVFDADEPTQATASNGKFVFAGLGKATYVLRQVLPDGWRQTFPAANAAFVINLADGQVLGGRDFTAVNDGTVTPPPTEPPPTNPPPTNPPPVTPPPSGTAQFSGYVVDDLNKDGKWSGGEKGIAGRTVYIDSNNNGALDAGEHAAVTASNGKYVFSGLGAGGYVVRQVLPTGWTQSNPAGNGAFVFSLGNGQSLGGKDFTVFSTGGTTTPPPTQNPSSNTWTTGPKMPLQLAEVAQFIIGDVMFVIGTGSRATLAYNFVTKTWYTPGTYAERPYYGDHHAVEVYNGKAYVIGGLLGSGGKVQIFDPLANTWTTGASAPWDGGSMSTALIGDKIYAAGGVIGSTADDYQGTGSTTQAAVYDIAADTWSPIASMPINRHHTAAATDGAKFYVFGGRMGKNMLANGFTDVQIYDPATNTWTTSGTSGVKPLPQARSGMGKAVYAAGKFYIFGGETETGAGAIRQLYNRLDIYTVSSNTWTQGANMPTPKHGMFPVVRDNAIYLAGGGDVVGVDTDDKLEIYWI